MGVGGVCVGGVCARLTFGLDLDKFDAPFLYEVCHFKAIPFPEFIEVSLVWVWVVCVRDDRSLGSSLIMVHARL